MTVPMFMQIAACYSHAHDDPVLYGLDHDGRVWERFGNSDWYLVSRDIVK